MLIHTRTTLTTDKKLHSTKLLGVRGTVLFLKKMLHTSSFSYLLVQMKLIQEMKLTMKRRQCS